MFSLAVCIQWIYIYIYIYIYLFWNMKSFSNETLWNTSFETLETTIEQSSGSLRQFGFCQNYELCVSCYRNLLETRNERALSAGEPCTCEYIFFLFQPFHKDAVSLHWYIAQKAFTPPFPYLSYLDSFKIAIFSIFLKVASNLKFYERSL